MRTLELKEHHRRNNMVGLLLTALIFSVYCTLPFVNTVSMMGLFVRFIFCFLISIIACLTAYKVCLYIVPRIHCHRIEAVLYEKWTDRTFLLILWGVLILGWFPAYLAFFPGIFGYDAPNQMQQILTNTYTAHHPVFHTMLLGIFMKCGRAFFGTYNGGVALFCIAQGLVLTSSIARGFLVMKRLKTPFPVLVVSLVWCLWNPVLQILTFNITKDILFGAMFLHFVLNCHEWFCSQGKRTLPQVIMFVLSGILMCLLRNQGIYIVLVLVVISMAVNWRDKSFLVILCVIVLLSQSFFYVGNIMGVQKGDAREMLSVPMQQLAFVCNLYMKGEAVNLTPEEFEKFCELVDREYISSYNYSIADPIKSNFDTEVLKQDVTGYLTLYIRVGLHNPGYYMTAFRDLVYPYWDMSENRRRDTSFTNTFPELSETWGISQKSLLPAYKEYLSDYILNQMEREIFLFSWILEPGLCIWIMTALFGLSIAQRNKAVFVPVMIGMLFLGTLMLGPAALLRYLYPLMILMPWFLSILCYFFSQILG